MESDFVREKLWSGYIKFSFLRVLWKIETTLYNNKYLSDVKTRITEDAISI